MHTGTKKDQPPERFQPYLSAYLTGGWRQDNLVLDAVDVQQGHITGVLRATEYFMPSDGVFHLTVPLAFIWVAQLAIIYACWEHDLPRKPGEVYLREIHLECRRPITKTEGIRIALSLDSKRYVGDGVFYSGTISVEDGAFIGSGKFLFPLPAGARKA